MTTLDKILAALKQDAIYVTEALNEESNKTIKLNRIVFGLYFIFDNGNKTNRKVEELSKFKDNYVILFYLFNNVDKDAGFVYEVKVTDYMKTWCLISEKIIENNNNEDNI